MECHHVQFTFSEIAKPSWLVPFLKSLDQSLPPSPLHLSWALPLKKNKTVQGTLLPVFTRPSCETVREEATFFFLAGTFLCDFLPLELVEPVLLVRGAFVISCREYG